ncbi:MAG TPA: phosphoglycerate mutase family protein [Clostridia bacterium]
MHTIKAFSIAALAIILCVSCQKNTPPDNQVKIQNSEVTTHENSKHVQLEAKQVIFIRHAEKENEDGTLQDIHLSAKGYKRANELPDFFMNHLPGEVHKPDLIIAMKQSHKKSSNRTVETVQPLAKALNIPLYAEYTRQETDLAVKEINQYGKDKTVLVCWEHEELVKIAKRLGAPVKSWGSDPKAKKNDDTNYDAIWVLTKTSEDKPVFSVYKQFDIGDNGETLQ